MKRYQVFVSSTYTDLIEERKEVIQALLELDCIPVGMELFPATDNDQWTLIKELIDESDYYILIVGGRYGSLNKEGISFTQMEYEYAKKIGVPTISFLHKDPDSIPVAKTDKNSKKLELLENFKNLVSKNLIKQWTTSKELGSVVSRSLIKLIRTNPRTGWVKADKISSDEANLEILKLKEQISELSTELREYKNLDQKNLAKGDDIFDLSYHYRKSRMDDAIIDSVEVTWNQLFSKTCTILMDESSEDDYKSHVTSYVKHLTKDKNSQNFQTVLLDDFLSILIQFKALGLIDKSIRKRSIKDKNTYWKLTEKGESLLTNLRAIRKKEK